MLKTSHHKEVKKIQQKSSSKRNFHSASISKRNKKLPKFDKNDQNCIGFEQNTAPLSSTPLPNTNQSVNGINTQPKRHMSLTLTKLPPEYRHPSPNFPTKVRIVEVGPRDGLQNQSEILEPEVKIKFINKLNETGLGVIEAGSFVSPKWVPQMAASDHVLKGITRLPGVEYPVLTPNMQGLERAIEAGATEVAVFAAASEKFSQKNINCSIDESLERFVPVLEFAKKKNIKVRGYCSTVLGCPYQGDVDPVDVARVAGWLYDHGCSEISLGDTIGTGTPIKTQLMLNKVLERVPVDNIAVHMHDTYGQALANILVALNNGVSVVDSAAGGLGGCPYSPGSSGNVGTEDVVYMLNGMGIVTGVDLDKLIDATRYITGQLHIRPLSKTSRALIGNKKKFAEAWLNEADKRRPLIPH